MKIKKCRNCNKNKFINLFSLGKLAYTGKFSIKKQSIKKAPISLQMCAKCKLVQLGNNFSLKYLYGLDYGYRTGINKTMTNHMKNIVFNLTKISGIKRNEAALDVASNDGTLLNFYNRKIITFGIDPVLKKYKKNYKYIDYSVSNFFNYNLIKKKIKKKFKIITALSVFYDLKKPNSFLRDIERLIEDEGVILLEFADLHSIIKHNMFDTICHEHLEYYSLSVIKKMLKKNNLKLFDVKKNSINGSSKQFYICKKNSKYKVKLNKINKLLKEEKRFNLDKKNTYIKFKNNIDNLKKKLILKIQEIQKKKQIIHGYGASTKGNVILQYFGITKDHIPYIADRNPKKYNLFTPGNKIQIISEKKSRSMRPDYYLVLPWHFKKEIILRENKTIKNSVSFIFPLPKFKIIRN